MRVFRLIPCSSNSPAIPRVRIGLYCLSLGAICLFFGFMSHITPLACDDLGYTPYYGEWPNFKYDAWQVLKAELEQWFVWNGRTIPSLINRLVILSADWMAALLNPLALGAMLVALEYLILGRKWLELLQWWHPLFLFFCIWIFTPLFGEAYLWRTGSAFYLYTTLFVTVFLCVCRKFLEDPDFQLKKWQIPCWFLLSLCAGWSNENIGLIPCFAALAVWCVSLRQGRKHGRALLYGAIIAAAGWSLIVIAPGQYHRAAIETAYAIQQGLAVHLRDFFSWWLGHQLEFLPLTLAFFAGFILARNKMNRIQTGVSLFLFLAAQASIGAFILSPLLSSRALANSCILLTASAACYILIPQPFPGLLRNIFVWAITISAIYLIVLNVPICWENYKIYEKRLYLLEHEKSPVLPCYTHGPNRYFAPSTIVDYDVRDVKNLLLKKYNLENLELEK